MDQQKSATAEDYVRSFLLLADRVREIQLASQDRLQDAQLKKTEVLLTRIEQTIQTARVDVEEIRLAYTRPSTQRNAEFILHAKARLSDLYDKLSREIETLEGSISPGSETTSIRVDGLERSADSEREELLQEVLNMIRIAISGSQNDRKKFKLNELVERITAGKFSLEACRRMRDRVSENPALPPDSIDEIGKLIDDN